MAVKVGYYIDGHELDGKLRAGLARWLRQGVADALFAFGHVGKEVFESNLLLFIACNGFRLTRSRILQALVLPTVGLSFVQQGFDGFLLLIAR